MIFISTSIHYLFDEYFVVTKYSSAQAKKGLFWFIIIGYCSFWLAKSRKLSLRKLIKLLLQAAMRKANIKMLCCLLFLQSRNWASGLMPPTGCFPIQPNQETSSYSCTELCFLYFSRSYEVENSIHQISTQLHFLQATLTCHRQKTNITNNTITIKKMISK